MQQQEVNAIERGQVLRPQQSIGSWNDSDGILAVCIDTNEGGACGGFSAANSLHLHPCVAQGFKDRFRQAVGPNGAHKLGGDAASAGTGHRLIGPFSTRKGLETTAHDCFTRGGNAGSLDDEIKIGGACNKYHC